MIDFIATRVAYRDRIAALALAGDIRCAGTGLIGSGSTDTGKCTHLGMAFMPTGAF